MYVNTQTDKIYTSTEKSLNGHIKLFKLCNDVTKFKVQGLGEGMFSLSILCISALSEFLTVCNNYLCS